MSSITLSKAVRASTALACMLLALIAPVAIARRCPNCMTNQQFRWVCRDQNLRVYGCHVPRSWFSSGKSTEEVLAMFKACQDDESKCYEPMEEPTDYWWNEETEMYEYEDGSPVPRFLPKEDAVVVPEAAEEEDEYEDPEPETEDK